MNEPEELMAQLWNKATPYNRAEDDRWRSYIVNGDEAEILETEGDCVTIVNGTLGLYAA